MPTLLKLSVWLYLCLLFPLTTARATVGGPVQVGYLVDYHFAHLDGDWDTTGVQGKISDWDVDSRAGTIGFAYWNYLTLTDSSATSGIEMWKSFLPQGTGTISVEFKFMLPTKVDGMVWSVNADRTSPLLKFLTSGGNFGYENASGTFVALITNYTAGQAYTVHADISLPNVSATVFIDGVQKAIGSTVFRSTTLTQAAQFYVGTPVTATGVQNLYYLTITKGYKLYERFTNARSGVVPDNWTATTAGGTSAAQLAHGSNPKDMLSFKLEDTSVAAAASLGRTFTTSSGKLVWEFKFMLPAKVDGVTTQLRNGSTSALTFTTSGGALAYLNSGGTAVSLWPNYKANVWYIVRVIANPATQKADIYINGKLKGTQVAFAASATTLDNVLFSSSVTGTGTLWVDDIYVYDFQPDAADYVPAVQTVTSRGYKVGMQSFFAGWRDGHHCGWDWIYRYPNHDPYIGFYDNGKPEAMDWQLKWMAESGVNFFLDCWYRNNDGPSMKEPLFEYTDGPLHNAYFYARYSDKVKFAIADYSLAACTASDFSTYILPYWIEYYFKDSRYYVIPGATKGYPVISIGCATSWINLANNAMKDSITALRAALAAEGFDGVVVLASYSGSDKAVMDNLYNAGIDYCYAYWGGHVISTTQSRLVAQRDAGSELMPIANAGQGQSGEAWDVVFSGAAYTSLTNFSTMSAWMRDTFLPSATLSGLLSSSMVMYDNWNEYGEGHYICPTNLAGFGYLDGIRTNYTTGSVTYTKPNAAQKARFNVLYTRGWEGRIWAFDSLYPDTEGWTGNSQVSGLTQNKGFLEGTIAGTDPCLLSRDGYAIDASLYKVIKVRLKNATAGTSAKVFFITTTDGSYSESKGKDFPLVVNDTGYTEYTLDMSTVATWTGTIRQLRLDPVNIGAVSGMTFSIDYIKVVSDGRSWEFGSLDAGTEGWTANYQTSGVVQNNGCLEGSITGTDPSILSADNCNINASLYKKIKVKLKNATSGTAAKFYFITNADGSYSESKAKNFAITANDTGYTEYTIDMSAMATWTGVIRRFRFDPVDTGATAGTTFSIDYIRVVP